MPATALVTSEQYASLPDEFDHNGNRIKDELIGGEIVKMSHGTQLHDLVKMNIAAALLLYLQASKRPDLKALVEIAYVVTPHDTFVPDVSVLPRTRLTPQKDKYILGAPELAIEVVSPTDTVLRLKAKVDTYLANGSHSVWVVFPDSRSVMVYTSTSVRELKADQAIEEPLLPGFSVPVSDFFELA
jgi:Uma2 family endonuclease